jgi:hypothetical protein
MGQAEAVMEQAVTAVEQAEAVVAPKLDQSVEAIMTFLKCRHFPCVEALHSLFDEWGEPRIMLWSGAQMVSHAVDLMEKIVSGLNVPE